MKYLINVRQRELRDGPDAGQPRLQPGRTGHGAASAEGGPTQKAGIGLDIVRVYNPYMNREEVYDWNTFSEAYKETTNNHPQLAVVVSLNEA